MAGRQRDVDLVRGVHRDRREDLVGVVTDLRDGVECPLPREVGGPSGATVRGDGDPRLVERADL